MTKMVRIECCGQCPHANLVSVAPARRFACMLIKDELDTVDLEERYPAECPLDDAPKTEIRK